MTSIRKRKNNATIHARKRAEQRGIPLGEVLATRARRYGVTAEDCLCFLGDSNPLSSYVCFREATRGKKVKIYQKNVYIYFSTSNRLITCYPLPSEFLGEYSKIAYIEGRKKNAYKQFKNRKRDRE